MQRSLIFVCFLTFFYCCTAQNNTLPQCAQLCAGTAATAAGCSSYSNATCVCASQPFQSAIQSCFNGSCATTEEGTAWVYYSNLCTNGSSVGSSSSQNSATVTSVSISTTQSATPSSSGTVTHMTPSASTNVSSTTTSSQTSTPRSSSGALAVTDVQMLHGIIAVIVGGAFML